jgi:hypothetical protein
MVGFDAVERGNQISGECGGCVVAL